MLHGPSGDIVGTTDTQSLTNKTITTIDEGLTFTNHSTAPGTTTNKLYANSTSLYFGTTDVLATGSGMASFSADSGSTQSITNGNTLTIAGGTGLDSVASATDTITLNIDSTVATLSGTQTLTNKSLTAPILTGSSTAAVLFFSKKIQITEPMQSHLSVLHQQQMLQSHFQRQPTHL